MAVKRKKSRSKVKIRSSIRTIIFLIFIILIGISVYKIAYNSGIIENTKNEEKVYTSNEIYSQTYKVHMKNNKYIKEEDLKDDQLYITDLLKKISTDIKFIHEESNASKINVTYRIKGIMKSTYSVDGKDEVFWNKEYNLMNEKDKSIDGNKIEINESLEINIEEYNKIVRDFAEEMKMAISSKLYVVFEANITSYTNDKMTVGSYSNETQITLGEKVTKITGKLNDTKENKRTETFETRIENNNSENIVWIILALIALFSFIKFRKSTTVVNRLSNVFKQELNEILNSCEDKIIRVESNKSIYGENVIEVSDINELIKLSEEAFKPILYYQVQDKKEAWFYVILEKEIYRFILK